MSDNIDGHVIQFTSETTRIAKPCDRDKHRPVVGVPVISVKIGDHCYHGLCDMGASASVIPIGVGVKTSGSRVGGPELCV